MKKLSYFQAIKFLSGYIGRHKRNFIMFYLGWLFDMLLGIVMPVLFGIMIDAIVYQQHLDTFLHVSLVFVVMSVFSCILYFLIYAQHQYLMSMYVYDIQRDIFRHLQKCDARFLSDTKTGECITVVQNDARECMHFVIRNIIHAINGIINLVLTTVYIFLISPWIGLLMLAAVPVSVLVNARFGKKIRACSEAQRECCGNYASYVYEVLAAIRDIRLLGAFHKVTRTIRKWHRQMFNIAIKEGVSTLAAQGFINGTNLLLRLSLFALTAMLVSRGDMTIGLFTVVMTYFTSLTNQVEYLSRSYLDAQNRVGNIQRIYNFMRSPTEENWPGKRELKVTKGQIIAKDIAVSYDKRNPVLKDFSLHIHPGERFALCGKSGCGKTTFAYMLLGFYRTEGGSLTVDGQELSECTLKSIRQNIGMISQEVTMFDGSLRENLLLGKPGATDDEIFSALEKAGLGDYVSGLDMGLDTVIGSMGRSLSGGQKQRMAIARIYLKNPSIILFDEATSSLDSETEQQIHGAWEGMLKGRTAIIIAHRQSSVMLCKHAAIMENGRIIEEGNPCDMEKSSKAFKKLFAFKEVRSDG